RRPDVVLLGKALGGGLMPISAMVTRRDLFERAYGSSFEAAESHNSTFSYNAVSAVAAMAALDLLTDDLIAQISRRGAAFRKNLSEALAGDPIFVEARGDGYMMGIALKQPDHPWISFEQLGFEQLADHATIGPLLCHRLYKRGFFAFVCGHDWSVLRLQPRFTIEESRLSELVTACREELAYIGGIV
ncbi:MAG: hypothetical protein JWM74_3941, partial [Myxococcaceae bacterium]|nr:hypothetical protein [Myxococcaceae bacterium]